MRVLFNCSVNVVGGAVQNAANFIKYAIEDERIDYFFLVSRQVYEVLIRWGIDCEKIFIVESPSRSMASRRKIKKIEKKLSPDLVYSMAGPTYVNFKAKHLQGISDPYITHADKLAFFINRSLKEVFLLYCKSILKGLSARFFTDFYVFQTETSRDGFCRRFLCKKSNTYIVQNAIGEDFFKLVSGEREIRSTLKILVPSAYYKHKNLEIIPDVCNILSRSELKGRFQFILTVPESLMPSSLFEKEGGASYVVNIGPYNYSDAHSIYSDSDVVFIPSVLETFSTSYLEAVAMNKPLVLPFRDFSKEICDGYALFYDPISAQSAADMILRSFRELPDQEGREKIISRYGSQKKRYDNIVSVFNNI